MWAFIAHPRTTDKDPLQARIQKIFPGGGGSEPRILNFNKQKKPKGGGRGGLVVINIVLREFLFVPFYSFNSYSVSALWKGGGGVWGPPLRNVFFYKKPVRFRAKIHHLTPSDSL